MYLQTVILIGVGIYILVCGHVRNCHVISARVCRKATIVSATETFEAWFGGL